MKPLLWCSSVMKIESEQKLSARLHLGAHYIFLALRDRGQSFYTEIHILLLFACLLSYLGVTVV